MVKRVSYVIGAIVGIFLTIGTGFGVLAQSNSEFPMLKKYSKWAIVAGPVLYNHARISPQYGDYTFENKPIWGYNAGFEYDFYPERKWSFITGLIFAVEPVYNVHYRIKLEDIYAGFEEDVVDKARAYAMTSFSAPLLVRFNIQAGKNSFINFMTGFKVMFFPPGGAEYSLVLHNGDDTESREVFGLRLNSPENSFQGSYVIGAGISYARKKVLIKSKLIYVMNFQNTIEGEYQFGNLLISPPTRGDYRLSGNYVGLLFSASLVKRKSKW